MSGTLIPCPSPDTARNNLPQRPKRRHFSPKLPGLLLFFCVPSCRFGYEVLDHLSESESPDEPGDGDGAGPGGDSGDGDTARAGSGPGAGGSGDEPLPSSGGMSLGSAGADALGGSAGAPPMQPLPDPEPPSILSAGEYHTCGLSSEGELYCWGTNTSSALGGFVGAESAVPVPVSGEGASGRFVGVAAGRYATCALREDASVYCWGENEDGQLGQGDTMDRAQPVHVPLTLGARALTLNYKVACAIDEEGALYCWGWNFEGQMGQDDTEVSAVESTSPIRVPSALPWSDVSAGDGHVCGIQADGALYCWGRNTSGELGRESPIQIRTPTMVESDHDWKLVRAAQSHTCGIREDKSLWCWGLGTSGQLGIDPAELRKTPTRVGTDNDWVDVDPQALHTCGLREDNSLWCWGRREEGQLTLDYDPNPVLTPLSIDPNMDWDLLNAGRFHTCGRRAGDYFCTGENTDGRLGNGSLMRSYGFVPVQSF